jgi:hypothetical protein
MAADERKLTRIEGNVLIGVHRRSSAARIDFFTAFEGAVAAEYETAWMKRCT